MMHFDLKTSFPINPDDLVFGFTKTLHTIRLIVDLPHIATVMFISLSDQYGTLIIFSKRFLTYNRLSLNII